MCASFVLSSPLKDICVHADKVYDIRDSRYRKLADLAPSGQARREATLHFPALQPFRMDHRSQTHSEGDTLKSPASSTPEHMPLFIPDAADATLAGRFLVEDFDAEDIEHFAPATGPSKAPASTDSAARGELNLTLFRALAHFLACGYMESVLRGLKYNTAALVNLLCKPPKTVAPALPSAPSDGGPDLSGGPGKGGPGQDPRGDGADDPCGRGQGPGGGGGGQTGAAGGGQYRPMAGQGHNVGGKRDGGGQGQPSQDSLATTIKRPWCPAPLLDRRVKPRLGDQIENIVALGFEVAVSIPFCSH